MHPLDMCLDDQSAKFIFASFLDGRSILQKENAGARPYIRASEPFYSIGFSSELSKFIINKE